ncbi:MAG: hypothetical protein LBL99_01805 [Holosporaceae bacterium]|jgi:hypothetical protein|nr:hypothetical protein [Holosporaceae bacterium]
MVRFVLFLLATLFTNFTCRGVPIATPDFDERNEFVIKDPHDWGYRTFNGKNGLIGVLWPAGTSFNSADSAIFVFLQNNKEKLPAKPCNINLFVEKCPKANFKFASSKEKNDQTLSIAEQYFSGRCGRTMILFKEAIEEYVVIIALVSAQYVTKKQLADAKEVASAYRKEIEKSIKPLKDIALN